MSALCSQRPGCIKDATMGIRTTAPDALRTQIFWDVTDAPKTAELLCEEHGTALLVGLAKTVGQQP